MALMKVQQATADADGRATKIIIHSEPQGLAGLAAAAKSVFDTDNPEASTAKR